MKHLHLVILWVIPQDTCKQGYFSGSEPAREAIVAFGKTCLEYNLKEILTTITALKDLTLYENWVSSIRNKRKNKKLLFGEGEISLDEFGFTIINITKAEC